jgi:hypothetical protein
MAVWGTTTPTAPASVAATNEPATPTIASHPLHRLVLFT